MEIRSFRILRPVLYLFIEHKTKRFYDFIIPSTITLIILLFSRFFCLSGITFEQLARSTSVFLGILPGFYIASLAAIATFNGQNIDSKIDGDDPPILFSSENGISKKRELTRRRFLCFLFGYLSFVSILLCIINIIFNFFDTQIGYSIITYFVFTIYVYLLSQMVITTFLGLFYLCDRLHWAQTHDPDDDED